jgi:ATP-binding cassette subfamily F protein uup
MRLLGLHYNLSMASYLQVENISKSYGPKVLFDNICLNINEGDKIALIAPNGTGKSSLLSIIAGKDSSDAGGTIKFLKDISIAFLEQNYRFDSEKSVFDEVYSKLDATTVNADQWGIEIRIKQILTSLNLSDFTQKMKELSGGEIKRVAIAGLLVSDADFLIMDEPTNHLDIDAIEFLEEYLKKSRCTLLMVTHDRYFLDRVCNQILELDGGKIYVYKGNYSYFLDKRDERISNFKAETDKARNLFRGELEWMRSTPCARTGKAKYRINAFYNLKDRAEQRVEEKQLNINVHSARLGKKIVNCRKLSLYFEEKCMLQDFTYNFAPGEKIGIIGKNGIGKSTFVNLLTGKLSPSSGEIERGETVRFGYYNQSGINFREDQTVFDIVHDIAEVVTLSDGTQASVTTFLQYFMFPPVMVNTKVEKLSGGERRRLYLLTILMTNPNFLILDEPTNDLDIITLNVLEEYLKNFKGSVIVVSHDRYFLDKIADHLFIFQGNGNVKDFVGNFSEYHEYMKELNANEMRSEKKDTDKKKNISQQKQVVQSQKKKLSYKEQRELEQLEKDIDLLSVEKKEIENNLSSGTLSIEEITEVSERIGKVIKLLDEKETRWLELVT